MVKTKIIATLGPASAEADMIEQLMQAGVNVFRLNFSHGTLEQHGEVLARLDQTRQKHPFGVAVMGDLCGPKIRTSDIEPDPHPLKPGDKIIIDPTIKTGTGERFGTNYQQLLADVETGDRVLIDDGQISLTVIGKDSREITCKVLIGGDLRSHKGINLPDSDVSSPSITERDWQCVDWAIEHKLDFLALSFVRTAEEIIQLKDYLRDNGSNIKVVSKIEKPQAIEHLESIIEASDVALVARGDLGVEMALSQVPLIQKRITSLCRKLNKPVIVATQMLQSMIDCPVPTRAEVSDVANAIMDLTDAVMLSGETAVGQYPLETIETIKEIAEATEAFLDESEEVRPKISGPKELAMFAAIARSVAQIVDEARPKLVVTWSQTGLAARLLSKARIDVPILVFTPAKLSSRQMCMHYGVIPFSRPAPRDMQELINMAEQAIRDNGWARSDDQIVLLAGRPITAPGDSNALIVHTLSG